MNEKKENVIVNGFFWRFAERCGVQLISAVVSILLARILTPDDYGKVALVTVFNNIMYVLLDCGIGTALVQKKEVDELDYSSAFFFSRSLVMLVTALWAWVAWREVTSPAASASLSWRRLMPVMVLYPVIFGSPPYSTTCGTKMQPSCLAGAPASSSSRSALGLVTSSRITLLSGAMWANGSTSVVSILAS